MHVKYTLDAETASAKNHNPKRRNPRSDPKIESASAKNSNPKGHNFRTGSKTKFTDAKTPEDCSGVNVYEW